MYFGVVENDGKRVSDSDAFSYACECIENGTDEQKNEFMDIAKEAKDFKEFADDLVFWFYSGSWIHTN